MSQSSSAYVTSNTSKDVQEEVAKQLSKDLRTHIRNLHNYEMFSKEWNVMCESLSSLASIAWVENEKHGEEMEEGTLWERDELAIRFILEEGKLNMCTRLMASFKEFKDSLSDDSGTLDKLAREHGTSVGSLQSRMQLFETSLGQLLRCAYQSVESMQTIDLDELLGHTVRVMEHWVNVGVKEKLLLLESGQELLVLTYLGGVGRHIDDINTERVCELFQSKSMGKTLLAFLQVMEGHLKTMQWLALGDFLQGIMSTDEYATHPDHFFTEEEDQKALWEVYRTHVAEFASQSKNRKRWKAMIREMERFELEFDEDF